MNINKTMQIKKVKSETGSKNKKKMFNNQSNYAMILL